MVEYPSGDQFPNGTVVQLKSGGPKMTVVETTVNAEDGILIGCTWFVGNEPTSGRFTPEMLEVVK